MNTTKATPTITTSDIKAKKSSDVSAANKIRSAWSLQLKDENKEAIFKYPSDSRRGLYKVFDKEIQELWTKELATIRESGNTADPDEVLIQVAADWNESLSL